MAEKIKMSRERYEEIVKELEYYENVRTKEVAEQLKEARSYGDLSENSEYDEAKAERDKVYNKIEELKGLKNNAEIVEAIHGDTIGIGCTVKILDLEYDEEEQYRMVSSQEADPSIGRISDDSPLGRSLMGHRAGDVITVEAPAGELKFKILEFSYKREETNN